MAVIANPKVSDYIPTVFPKRIKKSDVRIVKMLNSYFNILKVSCGTIKVNTLHRMCLLKLIKDILNPNGLLYPYMSDEDKRIWGKYLGKCFTELTYDDGGTDETVEENICPDEDGGGDTPIDPDDPNPTLLSIRVTPEPTLFFYGDAFEKSIVTAYYSNGASAVVTGDAVFSGYNMNLVGSQTVTVTYEGKTATYPITVRRKLSYITAIPTSETCQVGDAYSYGGVVSATYNNGTNNPDVTANCTFSSINTSTAGTKTLTITYTENGVTKTTTVNVVVEASDEPVTTVKWYTGVSATVPQTAAAITGASNKNEALVTTTELATPNVTSAYVWVALPQTNTFISAKNEAFSEILTPSSFRTTYVTINNIAYVVYYLQFSAPYPGSNYYTIKIS